LMKSLIVFFFTSNNRGVAAEMQTPATGAGSRERNRALPPRAIARLSRKYPSR